MNARKAPALFAQANTCNAEPSVPEVAVISEKTRNKYMIRNRGTLAVIAIAAVAWPLEVWLTN